MQTKLTHLPSSVSSRKALQSRGMSASLRRLAVRRSLRLLAAGTLIGLGAQSASASPVSVDALTFNTARTTTFRAMTSWTPRAAQASRSNWGLASMNALTSQALPPPPAATYTDSGTGAINMSTGFSSTIPAGGTTTNDTLVFNNATASTQTDDLTQPLNANVLTFSNAGALTLSPGTGSNLITLGGSGATLNLNAAGGLKLRFEFGARRQYDL